MQSKVHVFTSIYLYTCNTSKIKLCRVILCSLKLSSTDHFMWQLLTFLYSVSRVTCLNSFLVYCVIPTSSPYSEALVRTGFQSLQLVMADFLPALPPFCVPICVEVVGQYGLQKMDINISLTSVGLLVRVITI